MNIRCSKCEAIKPLTDFERRPDSKFGYRRTCKVCRRDAKNATNNRWYHRNAERERAKRRQWRKDNPEKAKLRDLKDYLGSRDRRNSYNRAYYQKHRERLIRASIERRRRRTGHQLDQGWTRGLRHSRIELEAQRQHWDRMRAVECVADLYENLSPVEREYCEAFMADDINAIPEQILESIRSKAGAWASAKDTRCPARSRRLACCG